MTQNMCSLLVLVLVLATLSLLTHADYTLTAVQEFDYGVIGVLSLLSKGPYRDDVQQLRLQVWFETEERMRVLITDINATRWEVPAELRHVETKQHPRNPPTPEHRLYEFSVTSSPFSFKVTRRLSKAVLFDTSITPFYFQDQYIEIGTRMPKNSTLLGFGERIVPLKLPQDEPLVEWNQDWGTPKLRNLYGHHPMFVRMEEASESLNGTVGNAHSVVLYNSNALEAQLSSDRFVYKVIGGALDFYFFLGPSPLQVIDQYTVVVGRPYMPPRWSIGFMQCRWGYDSANTTLQVVKNYSMHAMPLDGIINDIDVFRDYIFSTYNDELGSGGYTLRDVRALNEYTKSINVTHFHIIDPNIPALLKDKDMKEYLPYTTGVAAGCFVRHPANDSLLYNKQWPAVTVAWPDWSHPNVFDWWLESLRRFGQLAGQQRAIWIDMSEPSTFCPGEISDTCIGINDTSRVVDPLARPHARVSSPTDIPYPPFTPGAQWQHLEDRTFNISSHHYFGQHYNVKDLLGFLEQRHSAHALEILNGERAFTFARSTFMGSGNVGAHWTGDNNSVFEDLASSIAQIIALGLYGISHVGADICGFGGDTTPELCARWFQLGSLYPMSRDHSTINSRMQEAYQFDEPYLSMNRVSLLLRYSLLPYLYDLFIESHLRGAPVWRAMLMEFSSDQTAWPLDQQFMLGPALLCVPVVHEGNLTVTGYLPNADFYDFYSLTRLTSFNATASSGTTHVFNSAISATSQIPLILRGGHVVALQQPMMNTVLTHLTDYSLKVALDSRGEAIGQISLDDGLEIGNVAVGRYQRLELRARVHLERQQVIGTIEQRWFKGSSYNASQFIESIALIGLDLSSLASIGSCTLLVENKPPIKLDADSLTLSNGALLIKLVGQSAIPILSSWSITFASSNHSVDKPMNESMQILTS